MRTHITFDEISVSGTVRFTDPIIGKRRQKTRKFFQTVNPFNIDPETGLPKTRERIWKEICRERDEWLKNPPEVPAR